MPASQCAAPLDLFLKLRRLRKIIGKASKEEEHDLVLKALAKSEVLEISENGLRIQRKDTQGRCPCHCPLSLLLSDECCVLVCWWEVGHACPELLIPPCALPCRRERCHDDCGRSGAAK